jgi:hypothetical protein
LLPLLLLSRLAHLLLLPLLLLPQHCWILLQVVLLCDCCGCIAVHAATLLLQAPLGCRCVAVQGMHL